MRNTNVFRPGHHEDFRLCRRHHQRNAASRVRRGWFVARLCRGQQDYQRISVEGAALTGVLFLFYDAKACPMARPRPALFNGVACWGGYPVALYLS